jgi:hypothetical protein
MPFRATSVSLNPCATVCHRGLDPHFPCNRLSLRAATAGSVTRNPLDRGIFGAWDTQKGFARNLRIQVSLARSVSDEAIQSTDSSVCEHLQKMVHIFECPTGLSGAPAASRLLRTPPIPCQRYRSFSSVVPRTSRSAGLQPVALYRARKMRAKYTAHPSYYGEPVHRQPTKRAR